MAGRAGMEERFFIFPFLIFPPFHTIHFVRMRREFDFFSVALESDAMVSESFPPTSGESGIHDSESLEHALENQYRDWIKEPVGQRRRDLGDQIFRQIESQYGALIRYRIMNSGSFNQRFLEDIYQEVLLQLSGVQDFSEAMTLYQLVTTITEHTSRMHYRRATAQKRGDLTTLQFPVTADGEQTWEPMGCSFDAIDPVTFEELKHHIGQRFDKEALRVLVLRYQHRHTFEEVATVSGKNEKTIRRLCARFMNAVWEFLRDEGTNMQSGEESFTDSLQRQKPR